MAWQRDAGVGKTYESLFGVHFSQTATNADCPFMRLPLALDHQMALSPLPHGILHSLDDSVLAGWTSHYDEPYNHATTSAILHGVPAHATHVFVGARNPSGQITLGGFGDRNEVLRNTSLNQPHENNGVWWYLTDQKSFGFAPHGTIKQGGADTTDGSSPDRLSWHLEAGGGWRAGASNSLSSDRSWRKLVYWR